MKKLLLSAAATLLGIYGMAQCGYLWNMTKTSEIAFGFPNQAMTTALHTSNSNILYVAAKERGLLVYDISGSTPQIKDSVTVAMLGNMEVMNLYVDGNYLYLALGNHFVTGSTAGMAIVDIANATQPVLKDTWSNSIASGGAGIVKASGNYAYLGAMREGLIILDISDKSNISFKSQLIPSISYPNPTNPDPNKYNARGMELKDDKVYLCYDAGGLRIIDVADKSNPVEIGKYSNPAIINRPRAYNNIVLDGQLAYIAVDYCGMEVLDISNPANITQVSWWNPWHCEDPAANNWFNSAGHTNEIRLYNECRLVFMSSGRNEMQVLNMQDPTTPVLCDSFGNGTNTEGTWGVSVYKHKLFLSYIFVPLGIPFYSNWGGVKIIDWNVVCEGRVNDRNKEAIRIYPNPAAERLIVEGVSGLKELLVYDITARVHRLPVHSSGNRLLVDIRSLVPGTYLLRYNDRNFHFVKE